MPLLQGLFTLAGRTPLRPEIQSEAPRTDHPSGWRLERQPSANLLPTACRVLTHNFREQGPAVSMFPGLRGITMSPRNQAPMGSLPWIQRTVFHITRRSLALASGQNYRAGSGNQLMMGKA